MTNYEENKSQFFSEEDMRKITIGQVMSKYIYRWPLFLVSMILTLSVSTLYLRYSQPIYSINSTLLIKDEKKGTRGVGNDLLNELDLFGSSKVVDNEIEILKSKTLMRQVVDKLNLSVSIKAEGRVKNSDLYSSKIINIQVVDMEKRWFNKIIQMSIVDDTNYQLVDKESGIVVDGRFGEFSRTKLGSYKIDRGINFSKFSSLPITIQFSDPAIVADQYLSELGISLSSKQSTVLNLSIRDAIPDRGQDILNTLVLEYNKASLLEKNRTTQSTLEFIDERLKLITGELIVVEKDVEDFKSTRGLIDLSNDANLFLDKVKANDIKLSDINLQISVVQNIEKFVNSQSTSERLPSTFGINDPLLLGQITQLGELILKRDQLLSTTTENNPLVEPLLKQIETVKASIRTSVANVYRTLQVSKSDLERNNMQFQNSIRKVPGQERQLISIKRQQTIKESLYLYLLQKKEEAALSYAATVSDSRTVDAAYYSKIPVRPKRQTVFLAALLLGILLPAAYLYFKSLINSKVEDISDLRSLTSTPVLAEIIKDDDAEALVVLNNNRKAISEQFRALRTNMQYLHGRSLTNLGRVTLFTSGMSGEGKTFVASNLAAALAISGKRTILLELDLRKPKVSKYLKMANEVGLSNYLIGKAEITDIIKNSNVDKNLSIIGSGPIPPNPSELLVQDEIEVLVSYLRENFDEIVIDTPPVGLVTDALILSRLADVTLYLVREAVTFKEQARDLDRIYKSGKFPKLNVILNGVNPVAKNGYGYGYGYYTDDNKLENSGITTILKDILKRFK